MTRRLTPAPTMLAALAALLAAGLPGLSQDAMPGPGTRSPEDVNPLVDVDTGVFLGTATSFLQLAADASRLAVTQSADAGVRRLAEAVAEENLSALSLLDEAASARRATPTFPEPSDRLVTGHEQMLMTLAAEEGARFDRAYLELIVQVHRQLGPLLDSYSAGETDPLLRAAAERIAEVVRARAEGLGAD